MDSALQVDLARPEAPAQQVLDTALGEAATHLVVPQGETAAQGPVGSPQRSLKGGISTTTQIRLSPKKIYKDVSASLSGLGETANSMELDNFDETTNVAILQPVDGGFGAWSYVAGAFAMYIVVWGKSDLCIRTFQGIEHKTLLLNVMLGFPQAFPIFQTFLSSGDTAQHPNSIILPLLAPGLQDIEEGILFQLFPKSAKYRPMLVIGGIFTMTLALILASCANTALQIVLTQGVLFGVGGIMLNFVHVSIFSEWFEKKKGQAMGMIWLGYRVGALVFPLISQWLLDKHGFQNTLRILIAPMLALLLPSVVLLRGRYPAATVVAKPASPPISRAAALGTPNVMFYLIVALLFDFVVNVPKMFIATFGVDLKLNTSDQALALSLHVFSNMLGTYGLGWLSDTLFYQGLIGGCAISTSLVHFLVWGYVKTKFGLFVYAIASGLTGGGRIPSPSIRPFPNLR